MNSLGMESPFTSLDLNRLDYVDNIDNVRTMTDDELNALTQEAAEEMMFVPADQAQPTLGVMFRAYKHISQPIIRAVGAAMVSGGPFLLSEKFLMGAYTSKMYGCVHCCTVQEHAAMTLGVDQKLLAGIIYNVETAPIEPALKPCFEFIKMLVTKPWADMAAYRKAVLDAGWSKRALFDIISICSVFAMLSRLIMGCGIVDAHLVMKNMGGAIAANGYNHCLEMGGFTTDIPTEVDERSTVRPLHANGVAPINLPGGMNIPKPGEIPTYSHTQLMGRTLELTNLTGKRKKYNGLMGLVLEYIPQGGTLRVEVNKSLVIRVLPENLVCPTIPRPPSFTPEPPSAGDSAPRGRRAPYHDILESVDTNNTVNTSVPPPLDEHGPPIENIDDPTPDAPGNGAPAPPPKEEPPSVSTVDIRRLDLRRPKECSTLAVDRFCAVFAHLANEFATDPQLMCAVVEQQGNQEQVTFRIGTKWEKTMKALFAKQYTKMFKGKKGNRCHVMVYDKSDKMTGSSRSDGLTDMSDSRGDQFGGSRSGQRGAGASQSQQALAPGAGGAPVPPVPQPPPHVPDYPPGPQMVYPA